MRFDDESSELNHLQCGRYVIYLYLMGASSSRILDRDVSNLDTEFELFCVIKFFKEFSDESIGVNIVIFSIFNIYDWSSWTW